MTANLIEMNQELDHASDELATEQLLTELRKARRAVNTAVESLERVQRLAVQINDERDGNRELVKALLLGE